MGKADKYAAGKEVITAIYHENRGRYGYRRITAELRKCNLPLNHKTVQRLMKELGLVCRVRMKKYRSYKGEVGKVAPNLLNRDFIADKPNQKWVTDVTEFSLFGEKLYLSPILDLHSRDLVSYTISDHPWLSMVTSLLEKAFEKIPDGTNLILHPDQRWHYQHKQYQQMLREKGIQQSVGYPPSHPQVSPQVTPKSPSKIKLLHSVQNLAARQKLPAIVALKIPSTSRRSI